MTDRLVQASLRRLHSPDALDLRLFQPSDPLNFGILIQAMIGPSDAEGEDSFDFILCTPQRIGADMEAGHFRWGRATLIVSRYEYDPLERAVLAVCEEARGADWSSVAEKLNRFMIWEFEDYQAYRSI